MDDEGEYTKVVASYRTAVGRGSQTPTGIFSITRKERWHEYPSRGSIPYASRFTSGLYIHGPVYNGKDSHKMYNNTYEEIGNKVTSGCLRTTCGAAAWIFYNCPIGTTVEIVSGSPRGTSSSAPPSIDVPGVDPTDPEA